MSEIISKYVTCPKCEQKSMTDFVCSMNTVSEPKFRDKIFDESFFKWKCAKCGFTSPLMHPLLYSDLKNRFMVYYIPNVDRSQIVDEKLEKEFADLSDIKKTRKILKIQIMREKSKTNRMQNVVMMI